MNELVGTGRLEGRRGLQSMARGLVGGAAITSALLVAAPVSAGQAAKPAAPKAREAPAGDPRRGDYIVHGIAMCFECHSPRDNHGEILVGEEFMGGPMPVRPPWPNDWPVKTPRIRGLPGYTEEQGIRLLTQGAIGRDGRQLRRPMPRFRMTPEDAAAVVAYLRSLR